jgi:hypothetical protein
MQNSAATLGKVLEVSYKSKYFLTQKFHSYVMAMEAHTPKKT